MWVAGVDCDVASPSSVQRLAESAAAQLGSIDVWINNAGCSGTFQARARPPHLGRERLDRPCLLLRKLRLEKC